MFRCLVAEPLVLIADRVDTAAAIEKSAQALIDRMTLTSPAKPWSSLFRAPRLLVLCTNRRLLGSHSWFAYVLFPRDGWFAHRARPLYGRKSCIRTSQDAELAAGRSCPRHRKAEPNMKTHLLRFPRYSNLRPKPKPLRGLGQRQPFRISEYVYNQRGKPVEGAA